MTFDPPMHSALELLHYLKINITLTILKSSVVFLSTAFNNILTLWSLSICPWFRLNIKADSAAQLLYSSFKMSLNAANFYQLMLIFLLFGNVRKFALAAEDVC